MNLMCQLLAVTMIAFAGCGQSDPVRPTGTHVASNATKSSVIQRADAICQRLNIEFSASKPIHTVAAIAQSVPHRAVIEQRVVAELSELAAPTAIAHSLRQIISYRKLLARELAELGVRAKHKDMPAIQKLGKSKAALHRKLLATAVASGFKACGYTGSA